MPQNLNDSKSLKPNTSVKPFLTKRLCLYKFLTTTYFTIFLFLIFLLVMTLITSDNMIHCFQQAFSHKPFNSYLNLPVEAEKIVFGQPGHIFSNTNDPFEIFGENVTIETLMRYNYIEIEDI